MKQTIKSILAFVAVLLCGGAWAATGRVDYNQFISKSSWDEIATVDNDDSLEAFATSYAITGLLGGGNVNSGTSISVIGRHVVKHDDGILTVELEGKDGDYTKSVMVGLKIEDGKLKAKALQCAYSPRYVTTRAPLMDYTSETSIAKSTAATSLGTLVDTSSAAGYAAAGISFVKRGVETTISEPSILSEAAIRYDMSSSENYTVENGSVSTLKDISGHSKDASSSEAKVGGQSVTTPGKIAYVNGVPALDMGTSGSGIDYSFANDNAIRTVFWVMDVMNDGTKVWFLADDNSYHFHAAGGAYWGGYTSNNIKNGKTYCDGTQVSNPTGTKPPEGLHVFAIRTTGAVEASRLSQDRGENAENRNGGRALSELIIFDKELTDEQFREVTIYLRKKWTALKDATATKTSDVRISELNAEFEAYSELVLTLDNNAKLIYDANIVLDRILVKKGDSSDAVSVQKTIGVEPTAAEIAKLDLTGATRVVFDSRFINMTSAPQSGTVWRINGDLSSGITHNVAGTFEFENVKLVNYSDGAVKIDVKPGDQITVYGSSNPLRTAPSLNVTGGTVKFGDASQGGFWYGTNGSTTYNQTDGEVTALMNSTTMSGTGDGFLLGYSGSGISQFNISGGTFLVPNSSLQSYLCNTVNLSGTGVMKAKGVFKGNNATTFNVASGAAFELGSLGWRDCPLNLNGGTFKAYETTTMAGAITVSAASTIEVVENVELMVTGAISGTGAFAKTGSGILNIGSNRPKISGIEGQIKLVLSAEEFAEGKVSLPVSSDISSSINTSNVIIIKPNGSDEAAWATENPITYDGEAGKLDFNLATIAPITSDTANKSFSAAIGEATAGVLAIVGTDSDATAFTVTVDRAVPADVSVVVSGHVKFVATEGNTVPFATMTYSEGATIILSSAANITIPSGVIVSIATPSGTITNNGTLNVTGTCSFKLINGDSGTANFKRGAIATVSANQQSIHGTVNVEAGAKFINTTSDALYFDGTANFKVWGRLDMGATRWTMGSNTKLYAYDGAVIDGTGEMNGADNQGNFDPKDGNFQEYFIVSNYGLAGDATGQVTCSALTRTRATARVHIEPRMTLKYTGEFVIAGVSSNQIKILGGGTMELSNAFRSTSGILVDAGTLKIVAAESAEVTVSGPITGAGNVAFDGPGLITVGGVTTTGTCSVGTGEHKPTQIKISATEADVEIPQNVRNALRGSAAKIVFAGSGENGVSLQYGTTEGSAISAHYVFDGGEHDLKYGRSSNSQTNNFGDDATPENPTILVKDQTVLRFVGHDLNGWQGAANINGIIRIAGGGEIVAKQNGRNTFYYRQQFYFDPGAKLTIDMDNLSNAPEKPCFRPFGGVNKDAPQFYMPASEENSAPAVIVAKDGESKNGIFLAKDATKGVAFSIGANSTLRIDAELSSYDDGDPIGKFGEGTVFFNGAISQYSGTVTLHAGTIKSKNAFADGKVISGVSGKIVGVSKVGSVYTYVLWDATNPPAPIVVPEGTTEVQLVPGQTASYSGDTAPETVVKIVVPNVSGTGSFDITQYFDITKSAGSISATLKDNATTQPTVSAMAMPTTQEEGDLVSLTITPIPGLFYSIVTCDTPNGSFTGGDGEQATNDAAKTLSIAMPDAPVKYFKVRVKATK